MQAGSPCHPLWPLSSLLREPAERCGDHWPSLALPELLWLTSLFQSQLALPLCGLLLFSCLSRVFSFPSDADAPGLSCRLVSCSVSLQLRVLPSSLMLFQACPVFLAPTLRQHVTVTSVGSVHILRLCNGFRVLEFRVHGCEEVS